MLVSDVLSVPRSLLADPNKVAWSDTELISYLSFFQLDLAGLRRDIYSLRAVVPLVAGTYQTLPSGAIQFLDSYYASNGAPVFFLNQDDQQHSQFMGMTTPSDFPKIATADPRDRQGFRVFPPSTGSAASTLDLLYAATPPLYVAMSDTYIFDPDTVGAACNYVLGMAFQKNTERRNTVKAQEYMGLYMAWVQANLQNQIQDAAQAQ